MHAVGVTMLESVNCIDSGSNNDSEIQLNQCDRPVELRRVEAWHERQETTRGTTMSQPGQTRCLKIELTGSMA